MPNPKHPGATRPIATTFAMLRWARRFKSAKRGSVTVEFALVLPIMLTIYFGLVTITDGYAIKQRVELTSRTISDLTGRMKTDTINDADVTNVATASATIMAPYDSNGMVMTLASVVVRKNGANLQGQVCWSASRRVDGSNLSSTTPPVELTKGKAVVVPDGFRQEGTSYVLADVRQVYKPVVGHAISGDIELHDLLPWPVRNVQQVTWEGQGPCPLTPIS
jgi:Flp pilus assembly protein TadG